MHSDPSARYSNTAATPMMAAPAATHSLVETAILPGDLRTAHQVSLRPGVTPPQENSTMLHRGPRRAAA